MSIDKRLEIESAIEDAVVSQINHEITFEQSYIIIANLIKELLIEE